MYYGYDDAGLRTRKEVNGDKTWYLYDPAGRELGTFKMVPEVGAIKLKSYNLHGNGGSIGRVDVNYTRTGPFINEGDTTYGYTRNAAANYYIKDHLGSVRATMQRASTVFAEDTYPFGASQQRYEDGGTAPQRFDFTGKERDRESGLHYFGARNYDSDLGIWYGVDPLADKYPGLSPYNYCLNNPPRYIDPDGKQTKQFYKAQTTWKGLNQFEKQLVEDNTIAAYKVYSNSVIADNEARKNYPESCHNGKGDAFRHALWNALNSKDVGKELAQKFADAHEKRDFQPENEEKMDEMNNATG